MLRYSDFGRQIPFGTGSSISYNYLDYRVRNDSDNTYQLWLWVDDEYLCGELRAAEPQPHTFHYNAPQISDSKLNQKKYNFAV
ncbi:MAG: VanW family protein [Bacteroidales bacterium]|nr:VanW family protein [Bacteroidales bacterium]